MPRRSKERKRTAQHRTTDSPAQPPPFIIPPVLEELMARRTLICRYCKREITRKAVVFSRQSFHCVGCFAKTAPTDHYQVIDLSKLTKKHNGWTVLEELQLIQQAERCGIDDQPTLAQSITSGKTEQQVLAYISKHLCQQPETARIKQREDHSSKAKLLQLDSITTTKTIKEDYRSGLGLNQVQQALGATECDLNRMLLSWLHPKSSKEEVDYHLRQEMLEKIEREDIYRRIERMMKGQGKQQTSHGMELDSICSKQASIKEDCMELGDGIDELELMKSSQSFISRWQYREGAKSQQTKGPAKVKPISKQTHCLTIKNNKYNKEHQPAKGKTLHTAVK